MHWIAMILVWCVVFTLAVRKNRTLAQQREAQSAGTDKRQLYKLQVIALRAKCMPWTAGTIACFAMVPLAIVAIRTMPEDTSRAVPGAILLAAVVGALISSVRGLSLNMQLDGLRTEMKKDGIDYKDVVREIREQTRRRVERSSVAPR